jgi:hypothetical protein
MNAMQRGTRTRRPRPSGKEDRDSKKVVVVAAAAAVAAAVANKQSFCGFSFLKDDIILK